MTLRILIAVALWCVPAYLSTLRAADTTALGKDSCCNARPRLDGVVSPPVSQLIIDTFAGNGSQGYSGDGGPATAASLNQPPDVTVDGAGNTYIADQHNNRIRMVDIHGVITTFAGNGAAGFGGDGGAATAATLNSPTGVFVDGLGNVLIADVGNERIRKVDTSGNISTVAGSGVEGDGGDGGPAIAASLYNPVRVVVDPAGNIYIADQSNHRVRKVDTSGIVTTFAGTGVEGFSGDGGSAAAAELDNPTALALDLGGNLYICDQFNMRLRKVDTNGVITTIAGTGTQGFSGDGGPAISAELNYPGGITIDTSGNIFFSDDTNYRVREISPTGIISTIAGDGAQGFSGDGGPAASASFNGQFGLAINPSGNLLIADIGNNRIRSLGAASPVVPQFTAASLTNAASFISGGSAGALATLFGNHLTVNLNGVMSPGSTPLPTSFANTSVTMNGIPAPILAVANFGESGQINLQIPWELAGQSSVSIVVNNGISSNAAVSAPLTAAQPGVFFITTTDGAIEHVDGSIVSSTNPAATGETVVVFATGLGAVSPAVVTGSPTPPTALSYAATPPTVTIAGLPAAVSFAGEAPYFVGLNQLNVVVPAAAPSGSQNLVVSTDTISSKTVTISIQ